MNRINLVSILILFLLSGCKNKDLTKPATTDFRENYTGTFNIKFKILDGYHFQIYNDTEYYQLTEISYQIGDSTDKGFYGPGKFPAIKLKNIGASNDTSSWILGIDAHGNIYDGAPWTGGGFISNDSLFITQEANAGNWMHNSFSGKRT